MKKKYLVVIALLVVIFAFALVACDETTNEKTYVVEINYPISLNIELNSENIDFTKYFVIKDDSGKAVTVTEDMLDLSAVDTSKTGTFGVTLTYEGKSCTAIFTVVEPKGTDNDDKNKEDDNKDDDKDKEDDKKTDIDLSEVFALYDDYSKWNFVVKYTSFDGTDSYTATYKYLQDNLQYIYEYDDVIYSDYLEYTEDAIYYYSDNGDGTYVKYDDSSWEFVYFYYALWTVELTTLNEIEFTAGDGYYSAVDANDAGNQIIGEVEDSVYTDVKLYVVDGKISKIVVKSDYTTEDGVVNYTDTFEFSGYGTVNFDLSELDVTEEGGDDENPDAVDLSDVFEQYEDYANWNFSVKLSYTVDGFYYDETYNYKGENFQYVYESAEGFTQIDYVEYAGENEAYYYYYEGDGIYSKFAYPSDEFWAYYQYTWEVDLGYLGYFDFVEGNGCYLAADAATVGNTIFGESENENYIDIQLYISNGKITKLVVITDAEEDNTLTFEYSDYGNISFDLSSLKLSGDENPDNNDDPDTQTLTSVFTDKNLSVGAGQLTYTASRAADGFEDRGVQFLRDKGVAVVTSTQTVENVSIVTVTMASNATFTASVSVGGTAFYCGGATSVTVSEKTSTDYTFTTANPVSGKISITLTPDGGKKSMYISKIAVNGTSNGGNTEPDDPVTPNKPNAMEAQTYNPDTFDNGRLHEKMEEKEYAIGLPSYGDLNVLVIPVQLKGDTITQKQLADLNKALNGSSDDTGWESVSSYYNKSSYEALNLTFDIQDVYKAKNNASYYANYYDRNNPDVYGSDVILKEVLAYYDDTIDYSKYDTNGDGYIDAVYLIYSAPVAYQDSGYSENYENLYWAFVSWYNGEEEYDNLYAYYYLFAGFDFMEDDSDEGFTVNASTYIHETGHILGLDDYYDYDERTGSNEHLGGADMMDYTQGDQNVYSKIMLGWVTPEIVTATTTVTIESSTLTGDCILIPLNFDNSYFCEYLLIDLYTAEGLNEKHANLSDTYLYEGAEYGVRIYHVSSSIDKPYDTDYGSFTDCNNSDTSKALIKLLSADKKKKVLNATESAEEKDLWQTGDTLSSIYGSYKRNDGKVVNFDVTVTAVSAESATITITFDE